MLEWTTVFALLLASAGLLLIAVLSTIHSQSMFLYGHRLQHADFTEFRLAIQNAEASPLEGSFRVELECGPGAIFATKPLIYAGPRGLSGGWSDGGRTYLVEFDRLPAHDTWTVHCKVRSQTNDEADQNRPWTDSCAIAMRVVELDRDRRPRNRILRRMSADALTLSATDSIKAIGRTRKPLLRLGSLTALLATVVYALTTFSWMWLVQSELEPAWHDLLMLLVLWAATGAFIRLAAPPAVRAVQGYLDPSHVGHLTESRADGVTVVRSVTSDVSSGQN